MSRLSILLAAATLMLVVAAAPPAGSAAPAASVARSCKVGDYGGYGTTYVRSISARHVSCRRARRLVRAFHKCRKGPRGHCRRVNHFRCREHRTYGAVQFDSNVRCKRGAKVVRHSYTQNI